MERVLVLVLAQNLYRMYSPVGGRVTCGTGQVERFWQASLIDGHYKGEPSAYGRAPVSSRCCHRRNRLLTITVINT
jgi:hypothetical protein